MANAETGRQNAVVAGASTALTQQALLAARNELDALPDDDWVPSVQGAASHVIGLRSLSNSLVMKLYTADGSRSHRTRTAGARTCRRLCRGPASSAGHLRRDTGADARSVSDHDPAPGGALGRSTPTAHRGRIACVAPAGRLAAPPVPSRIPPPRSAPLRRLAEQRPELAIPR
jgi:hypothetical protein